MEINVDFTYMYIVQAFIPTGVIPSFRSTLNHPAWHINLTQPELDRTANLTTLMRLESSKVTHTSYN